MRGFGANRSRHLSDSCEPSPGPQEPLCPLAPEAHAAYLLGPAANHYGTLDPRLHHLASAAAAALPPDCLLPLQQMSSSSTFPRLHFAQAAEPGAYPAMGPRAGPVPTSLSTGAGLGLSGPPVIASGTATISSAARMTRLPAGLLDQLERRLPLRSDGFSTLQFQRRGRPAAPAATKPARSESPSRIRHLVHSVQKLFAKSQSLEGAKGVNGDREGGGGARRSKSRERARTEGAKRRPRPNISGFWSSDDGLDDEAELPAAVPVAGPVAGLVAGPIAVAYRNPLSMMTLGRAVSDSQAPPRRPPQGYSTIAHAHTLKASKSSGDLKHQACPAYLPGTRGGGAGGSGGTLVKRGSWSTLTLSQARQVLQKGSATVNRTLLKSKSYHQDLTCHYLQVPLGDSSATLGRGRGPGEIPCRRMRSGSYVKAMGDLGDSEDSEGSPKPSPKSAARRQSYLKATQQSLSEQQPPPPRKHRPYALLREDFGVVWSPLQSACSMQHLGSCLPSLREVSTNRSLDNLDCLVGPSDLPLRHWDPEGGFSQGCATLSRGSCIGQVEAMRQYEQSYMGLPAFSVMESQAVAALDLPMPTCFRSRSHSYLRAIQAGCSQDDDTASLDSDEAPPATTTVHTYSSSTISTCITTCKKTPPPVPPRTTSKPFISVTVQSSTESAQDGYLDGPDRRSEANSQSERSNSSDSIASTRTGSLAKCPAPTPVAAPRDLPPAPPTNSTSRPPPEPQDEAVTPATPALTPVTPAVLTPDQLQTEPAPKRKLSSIGIQVDCVQPIQREEPPPSTRFQSIGVQVENGRPLSRASSMTSRQETVEMAESQGQPDGPAPSCPAQPPPANPAQPNGDAGDHAATPPPSKCAVAAATRRNESLDPALDPSSLPPPDPSLDGGTTTGATGDGPSDGPARLRDGHWFFVLLQAETGRMEGWCQQMEQETKENQLSEEVLGKIRSAVGSAQLLISKKFQQFRGLCEQNLDTEVEPRPTAQDLAGFWDLLQLSIEDISMKFDELYHLRSNDWKLPEVCERKEEKKPAPPPVPKKPVKAKSTAGREKGDSAADKQRQEARRRLLAAKRAASERQNSATESADSIEIYVPEAQTRL